MALLNHALTYAIGAMYVSTGVLMCGKGMCCYVHCRPLNFSEQVYLGHGVRRVGRLKYLGVPPSKKDIYK